MAKHCQASLAFVSSPPPNRQADSTNNLYAYKLSHASGIIPFSQRLSRTAICFRIRHAFSCEPMPSGIQLSQNSSIWITARRSPCIAAPKASPSCIKHHFRIICWRHSILRGKRESHFSRSSLRERRAISEITLSRRSGSDVSASSFFDNSSMKTIFSFRSCGRV